MTQTNRWLTALALLVAFGACGARAEEEQQEPAPRPAVMIPPPVPVLFAPPCPVPMPVPPWAFGLASGPACLPYPCPLGCGAAAEEAPQYVVTAHMVKGDGDDAKVTMCPRVTVLEGQPATIHLQGYETAQDRSSLQMMVSVLRQPKGARLALAVTEANASESDPASGYARSHSETTSVQCNAPFGTPCVMDLRDGARMVVTVTEAEKEQHARQAACGCHGACCHGACCPATKAEAEEEETPSPLDAVGAVVDNLYDVLSDTATGALGWVFGTGEEEPEMEPAPQAKASCPSKFPAVNAACPLAREQTAPQQEKPCSSCCAACCPKTDGACTQCAATECAKKAMLRIHFEADASRTCVEVRANGKCWKGSADAVTLDHGRLTLEGDVRIEADGAPCIKAEKIKVDVDGLDVQVGD